MSRNYVTAPCRRRVLSYNFIIELRSRSRNANNSLVNNFIATCVPFPNSFEYYPPGKGNNISACLFYLQRKEAIDAFVFIWNGRLNDEHCFTPRIKTVASISFDGEDVVLRMKNLFVSRINQLIEGESVYMSQKKFEDLSIEIAKIHATLSKCRHRLSEYYSIAAKYDLLVMEKELTRKRLMEFNSAMQMFKSHIEGTVDEVETNFETPLFGFGDAVNWSRIQCLMMRECQRLDDGLPIYSYRNDILHALSVHQVVVLEGETGSGKSTQLIQFLADAKLRGTIICTQPRKIATTSLAHRVREESLGCYDNDSVMAFPSYSSSQIFNSKIVFTTDHCLLQHLMKYRNSKNTSLANISHIIIDEAHERSLNTDLLLALIKKFLRQRQDLKLIIMSATANSTKLVEYFNNCFFLLVKGRTFPVDIKYVSDLNSDIVSSVLKPGLRGVASYALDVIKMVNEIHKTEKDGSVLAFLTSQSEVEWACESFWAPNAVVLPFHGKLSYEEQNRILQSYQGKRKVIFATNLAETSLTIPGIKFVVDCGMVKESRFEPSNGVNVLKVCRISKSSAKQRAGRAGRIESGKCFRLYSKHDFEEMPSYPDPEIRRVHLGIAVLRILSLGIKNVQDFDFVDAPCSESIERAIRNLIRLGAIVYRDGVYDLTEIGFSLVKLDIEPRLGKLILDSFKSNLGKEGVILASVMANASSIFCRFGNDDEKLKSDCLKVRFCHHDGDLFTLLSVYMEWENQSYEKRNKWCWDNSINAKTMRRCKETILELERSLHHELNIIIPSYWLWRPHVSTVHDKALKKILLSSLVDNVAMYSGSERLGYEVALTGQRIRLHPSCSLLMYNEKPNWVVFGEILSASNEYLVCVTSIDYDSLHTLQPSPLFDPSVLESRRIQMNVIGNVSCNLLRRLRGKLNSGLNHLVSRIQKVLNNTNINIEIDFNRREIQLFASSKCIKEVTVLVNNAVEYERKWLRDECIEKYLFHGGTNSPPVALFGAGAEIKYLDLEKRGFTVEILHAKAQALDDKELLMRIDDCVSGISGFFRPVNINKDESCLEKWGKVAFHNPEAAETAVAKLNGTEFHGSTLKLLLTQASVNGPQMFPFHALRAKIFWPRRVSKGVAIVKCYKDDVAFIVSDCFSLKIRDRLVYCRLSNICEDSIVITRIHKEVSESEIFTALRNATKREILDVFLLRGDVISQPSITACEEILHREIAPFMQNNNYVKNFRVEVMNPEPKDYLMKALITFDGSLHLQAAKALDHINGKALTGCFPWQKVQCQGMFHSSVSCPARVYSVIKKELESLFQSFKNIKGVSTSVEKNDNGFYRVSISANSTKTVAVVRKPVEKIMKGKIITHPNLTPSVLQLLFSREGISVLKSLERETGTYILYYRQDLTVKVFGPQRAIHTVEKRLVNTLLSIYENKQLEIWLRGPSLPSDLMKQVIQKFGPDLHGLKEQVPGAEFYLNTRSHILSVKGSNDLKQKVQSIILTLAQSLDGEIHQPFNKEGTCPICLCEIEDGHQLEACGHEFCRLCLLEQLKSAMRNHDVFPLLCTYEGCNKPILVIDLKSLLTSENLDELFRASLSAFVMSSGGKYKFCPSPDCPGVYRAALRGTYAAPYDCRACFVETCTMCDLEYHPGMSCERYLEYKENPDISLQVWSEGKHYVKNCPGCNCTIEKMDGCDHIACLCGRHICWSCLEWFDNSDDCYTHLRNVHAA